jgi:hypothetical protein
MVTTDSSFRLTGLVDGKLAILGLDPGGTTGWALYTADVIHNLTTMQPEYYNEKFNAGQIGPGPHHRRLWGLLEQWTVTNTIFVCESFEYRRNPKDRGRDNIVLDSKEYIGVVNLYQQMFEHNTPDHLRNHAGVKVVYQTAATGKGFWSDEKLKAVNKFSTPKTKWPHANDAMRHLLHYMAFKMHRNDLLLPLRGK